MRGTTLLMLAPGAYLVNNAIMYVETEKFLVIPDVHGASDKLRAVLDHYENENPQFVSLGDVLDGGQSHGIACRC